MKKNNRTYNSYRQTLILYRTINIINRTILITITRPILL